MTPDRRMIGTPAGRIAAALWPGQGDRAPLVLFHDSLGSVSLWRDFPGRLAAATGRGVIAYDRLGFGASDPAAGRLAPDFVAAEATQGFAAVRAALGIGRFVALGHSVGGGIAVCAAAAWPEDCVAVVSISAQHHNDDRIRDGIRAAKAGFAAPGALDRLARHHGDEARWVLDSWTETWLSPAFAEFTLAPCRAAVRCPVLALHGAADEYGTPDHARAIAGPDGVLDVMPGLGHFPHREAEAAVVDRIAGFLAPLP